MNWKNFKLVDDLSGRLFDTTTKDVFIVRDLWIKKDIGDTRKTLNTTLAGKDVLCLKIRQKAIKNRK